MFSSCRLPLWSLLFSHTEFQHCRLPAAVLMLISRRCRLGVSLLPTCTECTFYFFGLVANLFRNTIYSLVQFFSLLLPTPSS